MRRLGLSSPMWVGCVSLAGDAEASDWYRRTQMPVFAWSLQARGFFSGRYTPGMVGETNDQRNVIRTYFSNANWERYRRADELASRKGCSLQQITLAWVLHQPLNVYALIGPATSTNWRTASARWRSKLTPDELAWLNLERAQVSGASAVA